MEARAPYRVSHYTIRWKRTVFGTSGSKASLCVILPTLIILIIRPTDFAKHISKSRSMILFFSLKNPQRQKVAECIPNGLSVIVGACFVWAWAWSGILSLTHGDRITFVPPMLFKASYYSFKKLKTNDTF